MKSAVDSTVGHMNMYHFNVLTNKNRKKELFVECFSSIFYPAPFFIYVNSFCDCFFVLSSKSFCDCFFVLSSKYKLFDSKRNASILKELKTASFGKNQQVLP